MEANRGKKLINRKKKKMPYKAQGNFGWRWDH